MSHVWMQTTASPPRDREAEIRRVITGHRGRLHGVFFEGSPATKAFALFERMENTDLEAIKRELPNRGMKELHTADELAGEGH